MCDFFIICNNWQAFIHLPINFGFLPAKHYYYLDIIIIELLISINNLRIDKSQKPYNNFQKTWLNLILTFLFVILFNLFLEFHYKLTEGYLSFIFSTLLHPQEYTLFYFPFISLYFFPGECKHDHRHLHRWRKG